MIMRIGLTRKALVPAAFMAMLAASSMPASAAGNDCDRQCLKKIADLYFDALAQHQPSLLPASPNVKFTENGRVLKLGEGLWKNAGKPAYRMELFDPMQGGIGIEAVVPDGTVPVVMALRLKVENQRVTEVESVLIRKDEKSVMSQPENLTRPNFFWTRTIRVPERNSRYELVAATEAYWRAFESEGTPEYIKAPLLPDTERFENGVHTTNVDINGFPAATATEQFDKGGFTGSRIYDRRYPVVDEEVGAVLSMVRFGRQPNAPARPAPAGADGPRGDAFVGEFFAITQGKIREIHAVFVGTKEQLPTPW